MKYEEMLSNLTEQSEKLKEELLNLEQQFNFKKEQYLKIQGAIEVLTEINNQETN